MAVATTYAPLSPYIIDPATGRLDKQYRDFFEGIEFIQGAPIASISLDPTPAACGAALAEQARHIARVRRAGTVGRAPHQRGLVPLRPIIHKCHLSSPRNFPGEVTQFLCGRKPPTGQMQRPFVPISRPIAAKFSPPCHRERISGPRA